MDKTHYIKQLCDSEKVYLLSRPRRFGKSLFLDTMQHAFEGRKELFGGLSLENNWDWNTSCPVLKISFGSGVHRSLEDLQNKIESILIGWKNQFNFVYETKVFSNQFLEAIQDVSPHFS